MVGANRRQSGVGWQLLLLTVIAGITLFVLAGRTGGFLSLWLTADQQGRRLYEALEFRAAAERFDDATWKGVAAYRSGLYTDAAANFGRLPTAEGFFNRGNALMKGREYANAIKAYEQAVAERPEWLEAQENLALASYVVSYIERAREQSDTGDESELSADDFVFDNTEDRGIEIEVTRESTLELESAEKWMRSVDTETRDFLQKRFLLEAVREGRL